ncbi:hypothetical protein BTUL_0054g00120 [Botrytis tulipae]|uniref:Uncharacterized protein n=1 Tax=Botrytis tulipae TaxID=87230 RepID=A0A4Z1EPQ6_9HELO|nr:hypothetical protein BTUL_0054g00120 [Botrytis tulipae]
MLTTTSCPQIPPSSDIHYSISSLRASRVVTRRSFITMFFVSHSTGCDKVKTASSKTDWKLPQIGVKVGDTAAASAACGLLLRWVFDRYKS